MLSVHIIYSGEVVVSLKGSWNLQKKILENIHTHNFGALIISVSNSTIITIHNDKTET